MSSPEGIDSTKLSNEFLQDDDLDQKFELCEEIYPNCQLYAHEIFEHINMTEDFCNLT